MDRKGRKYHPLRELILARAREFFREPEAIFWVYIFPVLLAVGLGIAFRDKPPEPVRVVVESAAGASAGTPSPEETTRILRGSPRFRVEVLSPERAWEEYIRGKVDVIVRCGSGYEYIYDRTRTESAYGKDLVDDLLRAGPPRGEVAARDVPITEPGGRYIDFLIPGLIGLNIMGGGLWGVGFVIVDMRVRKLLKRFLATPMRKSDFLLSYVGSRMLFLVPEIAILLLLGWLAFGVPIRGSFAGVVAIVLVSSLGFSGIGLLVASRATRMETVSGILNLVMMPMWIFSGVFFSAERFPGALQPFIHALPLTATNDSLRAVMLEGRPLSTQAGELAILAAWGIASYAVSLKIFRWS